MTADDQHCERTVFCRFSVECQCPCPGCRAAVARSMRNIMRAMRLAEEPHPRPSTGHPSASPLAPEKPRR